MFSLSQYTAARTSAVMIDRSALGTIALTGADRRTFLHGLLTNDIAGLTPGKGTYAAYLTPQGRMISDMRVIETGSRILLGVEREVADGLARRLDSLIFSEDVQVVDVSREIEMIGVHGPSATVLTQRATGLPVDTLANQYDNVTSGNVTIVRDDALALAGFDIHLPSAEAHILREKLSDDLLTAPKQQSLVVFPIDHGLPARHNGRGKLLALNPRPTSDFAMKRAKHASAGQSA